jgi:hypothetical protein
VDALGDRDCRTVLVQGFVVLVRHRLEGEDDQTLLEHDLIDEFRMWILSS